MTNILSALYARVSSERQAQAKTIESQIAALEKRIADEGENLPDDHYFIDNVIWRRDNTQVSENLFNP